MYLLICTPFVCSPLCLFLVVVIECILGLCCLGSKAQREGRLQYAFFHPR